MAVNATLVVDTDRAGPLAWSLAPHADSNSETEAQRICAPQRLIMVFHFTATP
jgi:hypothetical protein